MKAELQDDLRATLRIWAVRLVYRAAARLPIRQRVVLATSHKARLDGNLACIRSEAAARNPPLPVVEVVYRPGRGLLGLIRTALHEMAAAYYLATSRVFVVDDYFFPIYPVRRRTGTTIVQTWHACGPFKKFGYSLQGKSFGLPQALVKRVPIHSNYDMCLAGSPASARCMAEAFRLPIDRFVTDLGIPRTDLLFGEQNQATTTDAVLRRYGIPANRRVVLYAPTFRGDSVTSARAPENLDLRVLGDIVGDQYVLLLRLHPFVRSRGLAREPEDFVIDVSDHPEVNELMLASDVLVTDYSSVIFEFALLGRPIVLFAPDHEAYDKERGFYFDYRSEGPGPVFEDTVALAEYLKEARFDVERVQQFSSTWFMLFDGRSTRRFVDQVVIPRLASRDPR